MNKPSPLSRFIVASRDFGLGVAFRVAYSKVRGGVFPSLALPEPPSYDGPRRELSVLIDAGGEEVATLEAIVAAVGERHRSRWEVCVCAQPPVRPEMQEALSRLRGTRPWLRIVPADGALDAATARRWTVEQATGEFIALVAPGFGVDAEGTAKLLARLRDKPEIDAAVLIETNGGSDGAPARPLQSDGCRMVLQRKSGYLTAASELWPLAAPALAKLLDQSGARIGATDAGWIAEAG